MAFTEPLVPTGIKTGVCTVPCGRAISPVLARVKEDFAFILKIEFIFRSQKIYVCEYFSNTTLIIMNITTGAHAPTNGGSIPNLAINIVIICVT